MTDIPTSDETISAAAVIASIEAARPAITYGRTPSKTHRGARYDSATDTYSHTNAKGADADGPPPSSGDGDVTDTVDLVSALKQMVDETMREDAKLKEHTFDPQTGAKVPMLQGEARRVQELKVAQLLESASYQVAVYNRAADVRAAKAAAGQRVQEADAMEVAWTGGDPRRTAILREETERAEARALAEVTIRRRLGQI